VDDFQEPWHYDESLGGVRDRLGHGRIAGKLHGAELLRRVAALMNLFRGVATADIENAGLARYLPFVLGDGVGKAMLVDLILEETDGLRGERPVPRARVVEALAALWQEVEEIVNSGGSPPSTELKHWLDAIGVLQELGAEVPAELRGRIGNPTGVNDRPGP
jgi:hypothetical protein